MGKNIILLKRLIREEILRRLHENEGSKPAEQAKQLGLTYAGWGKWMDDSGKVVAKTVNGQLVKLDDPEEPEDHNITNQKVLQQLDKIFAKAGEWAPQSGGGSNQIIPAWNKTREDVPFDANADETVQKLLSKVGDPATLVRWLVKKFQEETPNGKKRIIQYLGILKKMGFDESNMDGDENSTSESEPERRELFSF